MSSPLYMNPVITPNPISSTAINPLTVQVSINKLIGGLYAKINQLENRLITLETKLDHCSQILKHK